MQRGRLATGLDWEQAGLPCAAGQCLERNVITQGGDLEAKSQGFFPRLFPDTHFERHVQSLLEWGVAGKADL